MGERIWPFPVANIILNGLDILIDINQNNQFKCSKVKGIYPPDGYKETDISRRLREHGEKLNKMRNRINNLKELI